MQNPRSLLLFSWNFLKNPTRNASLVPSSARASRQMLEKIDFSKIQTIAELGPGTGVFTQEILKRCRPDAKLILIEIERSYIIPLRRQFGHRAIVEHASAHLLESILNKYGIPQVDLIVSGLPFSVSERETLLNSIQKLTDQGAIFRFFTYLPHIVKWAYHALPVRKIAFVTGNFPPLWVYGIN
ncbi:MAG: hypothetical protein HY978_04155 [Candidatus Liptonbacteria bacterium]|nr:hypothetical protein [Candidatus Liptonbacteria bacterium]